MSRGSGGRLGCMVLIGRGTIYVELGLLFTGVPIQWQGISKYKVSVNSV